MTAEKEKLLNDSYEKFMEIGLSITPRHDMLDDLAINKIMGFGSAVDEKIFSITGLEKLIDTQEKLLEGVKVDWKRNGLLRYIAVNENTAVFADDIIGTFKVDNESLEMYLRFSIVFEFINSKWMAVHWHGSKPENVKSEVDGFGIEQWKQKNAELEKTVAERTNDLLLKNEELGIALKELKSTQTQLIQKEKLASLGELTAGIAHEIQNPLNFVNNFSEVNTELIDEMQQEMDKGNLAEAKEISNDIKENEQKIIHHGKRAGDIVKGMLQHSRSSSGVKEPTDINALADEYLRLANHGWRAKDKTFNSNMITDFDERIDNINIIPQDIGRVILNLITNAFYVVNEKSKQGIAAYDPTVSISTKMVNDKVEIKVIDNGNGIPEKILDKIFQPFFTTKPTGQGIGLGLSLSYDIVKTQGGDLKVETKEGEGSIFTIQLPIA